MPSPFWANCKASYSEFGPALKRLAIKNMTKNTPTMINHFGIVFSQAGSLGKLGFFMRIPRMPSELPF
jgi:hypothetical protein